MNQNFQPQNTFHQKPRVSDFKFQSPEVMQKFREEDKIRQAVKLSIEESPAHRITVELKKRIDNILYDIGKENYFCKIDPDDENFGQLILYRHTGSHTLSRFMKATDNDADLAAYIQGVNEICKSAYEKSIADTKLKFEEGKKYEVLLDEAVENFKKLFNESHAEREQVEREKSRPCRVYSDAEKAKYVNYQTLPEEDAKRSRDNILKKKQDLKKRLKEPEQKIKELDDEINLHVQEIEKFEERLNSDLQESEFKDLKLSQEFRKSEIEKLRKRMVPLFDQTYNLDQKIKEIDVQISVLDMVIDAHALAREAGNWQRRRDRVLDRINKILRDQGELYNLRDGLNQRWQQLTNDTQNLCPVLNLKSNARMFFL